MTSEINIWPQPHDNAQWVTKDPVSEAMTFHGTYTVLARDGDIYWIRSPEGDYDFADVSELFRPEAASRMRENMAVSEMFEDAATDNPALRTCGTTHLVCRSLVRAGYSKD